MASPWLPGSPSLASTTPKRSMESSPDQSSSSSSVKRRRISDGDVVIELVESETSPSLTHGDSVIIHEHMEEFGPVIDGQSLGEPLPQQLLQEFSRQVENQRDYINKETFEAVAAWLHRHLQSRIHPSMTYNDLVYPSEPHDLERLSFVLLRLLEVSDPFSRNDLRSVNDASFEAMLQTWYQDVISLGLYYTAFLENLIDSTLYQNGGPISIPYILFPLIVARLSNTDNVFVRDLRSNGWLSSETIDTTLVNACRKYDTMPDILAQLLVKTVDSQDKLLHSWHSLEGTLDLLSRKPKREDGKDTSPSRCERLYSIMSVVLVKLLPHLCDKRPRHSDGRFYRGLSSRFQRLFNTTLRFLEPDDLRRIFNLMASALNIESGTMIGHISIDFALLSAGSRMAAIKYMWNLQLYKTYIVSDFMGLRTLGVTALRDLLLHDVQKLDHRSETSSRDVVHLICAVLKQFSIVPYILGPQSHAALLREAKGIVSFLARHDAWDKHLTDEVWQSCISSTEDEFVKSAFVALEDVSTYLSTNHLLDLVKKYSSTPVKKLNLLAARFWSTLLRTINTHQDQSWREADKLTIPHETSMEILYNTQQLVSCPEIDMLRQGAMSELLRPASDHSIGERLAILQRCVQHIQNQTEYATISCDILRHYLRTWHNANQMDQVSLPISVRGAVDEFVSYIQQNAQTNDDLSQAMKIRVETIALMLDLPGEEQLPDETVDEIWLHTVSNEAPHHHQKQLLNLVLEMPLAMKTSSHLSTFIARSIERHVSTMSPKFVSASLVHCLLAMIQKDCDNTTQHELLRNPKWQALMRLGLSIDDVEVWTLMKDGICSILDQPSLVCLQYAFIAERLEQLTHQASLPDNTSDTDFWTYRNFEILHALSVPGAETPITHIRLCETTKGHNPTPIMKLNMEGQCGPTRLISVSYNADTLVSDLTCALRDEFGARDYSIVNPTATALLSSLEDALLSVLQSADGSECSLRPVSTLASDLETMFRPVKTGARALLDNYEQLEALLDSPGRTAGLSVELLRTLPPPNKAIEHLMSLEFDEWRSMAATKPWRVMHAVDILWQHQMHCTALGIDLHEFILHGHDMLVVFLQNISFDLPHKVLRDLTVVAKIFTNVASEQLDQILKSPDENVKEAKVQQIELLCFGLLSRIDTLVNTQCQASKPLQEECLVLVVELYGLLLELLKIFPSLWSNAKLIENFALSHSYLICQADASFLGRLSSQIDAAVKSCTDAATMIYLGILSSNFEGALHRPFVVSTVCSLLRNLLKTERVWNKTQQLQDLLSRLTTILWTYQHAETMFNQLTDQSMNGLLHTIQDIVVLLAYTSTPTLQPRLASTIYDKLLFADTPVGRPLLQRDNRLVCFEIIQRLCDDPVVLTDLSGRLLQTLYTAKDGQNPRQDHRSSCCPGGLTNLRNTCYMNSLLQQIFSNVRLRQHILNLTIEDAEKQKMLVEIQRLFVRLQESIAATIHTRDLAKVMQIDPSIQDDVHAFYSIFTEAVEESIIDTQERRDFIELYSGKATTQIRGACGHVSTQDEIINGLSVTVQNRSGLEASLQEYFDHETLEGDNCYKCTTCDNREGRLVQAVKRTSLDRAPDILNMCLKRCGYNAASGEETKNNDAFSFPEQIDMACYQQAYSKGTAESTASDMFTLVGVIAHYGTLSIGHYWSFVRRRGLDPRSSEAWTRLEDSSVRHVSYQQVYEECIGGGTDPVSAYMLFYERDKSMTLGLTILEPDQPRTSYEAYMPPRVPLPEAYQNGIDEENRIEFRCCHLLDPALYSLITSMAAQAAAQVTSPSLQPDNDEVDDVQIQQLRRNLSIILSIYTSEVLMAKNSLDLSMLSSTLDSILETCPIMVHDFVLAFTQSRLGFIRSFTANATAGGRTMGQLLIAMLQDMDVRLSKTQAETAHACVLKAHHELLCDGFILGIPTIWREYFNFVYDLAVSDAQDLDFVLDGEYVRWTVSVLQADMIKAPGGKYHERVKIDPSTTKVLYAFLGSLLGTIIRDQTWTSHRSKTSAVATIVGSPLSSTMPWLTVVSIRAWTPTTDATFEAGKLVSTLLSMHDREITQKIYNSIVESSRLDDFWFEPILCMLLRYGSAVGDNRSCHCLIREVLETMTASSIDEEVLKGLSKLAKTLPYSVMGTMVLWVQRFIQVKSSIQAQAIELVSTLLKHGRAIHDLKAAFDPEAHDMRRILQVNDMLSHFTPILQHYGQAERIPYVRKIIYHCCGFANRVRKQIEEELESSNNAGQPIPLNEQLCSSIGDLESRSVMAKRILGSHLRWHNFSMMEGEIEEDEDEDDYNEVEDEEGEGDKDDEEVEDSDDADDELETNEDNF